MAELELKRLREVRRRAQELLRFADTDLRYFLHEKDEETFRRKPESESIEKDVNVTTTCSCVMALALSNLFRKFFKAEHDPSAAKEKAQSIFNRLVKAPWMSSGLTANNAFSTALVIRTFGFLKEEAFLKLADFPERPWELDLGIKKAKVTELREYLKDKSDESSRFLYASLSDSTRRALEKPDPTNNDELQRHQKKLTASLALDFRRLIQSGWIYSESRFPNISSTS